MVVSWKNNLDGDNSTAYDAADVISNFNKFLATHY